MVPMIQLLDMSDSLNHNPENRTSYNDNLRQANREDFSNIETSYEVATRGC